MNKRYLTNFELDELGRKLIKASVPSSSEIEEIVSKPELFHGVLVKAASMQPVVERHRSVFGLKTVALSAITASIVSAFTVFAIFERRQPADKKAGVQPNVYRVTESKPQQGDTQVTLPQQQPG